MMFTMKGPRARRLPWAEPRPARVLLVDDHPLLRAGLRELLEDEATLQVCGEAEALEDALQKVRSLSPDVVITDIILKRDNGLDLIDRLQEFASEIRILVLSMHDGKLYAERALAAGAMGFVSKQQPAAAVLEACRNLMQGKFYLPPDLAEQIVTRLVRGSGASNALEQLSPREREVLGELGQGRSAREIAEHLGISIKTVETYREQIKTKLNLHSANELVHYAVTLALEKDD